MLRQKHQLDMIIANAENSAGGSGITLATASELFEAGVDIMTAGDHLWDQKEVTSLLQSEMRLVRPLNYPQGVIGQGSAVWRKEGLPPVAVVSLQGRTFMPPMDNPFVLAKSEIEYLRRTTPVIFIDIHAEATSEKVAMARMLDGQISAIIGTHTHVQTADDQILPGGTAFLTDAGFTGPHDSVLGREVAPVVQRFLFGTPQRFTVASGRILLQGAVVEIDNATGKALKIERVSEQLP